MNGRLDIFSTLMEVIQPKDLAVIYKALQADDIARTMMTSEDPGLPELIERHKKAVEKARVASG